MLHCVCLVLDMYLPIYFSLEQVVETIDDNDERNKGIQDSGSIVTNLKEMAKRMWMKYAKYYGMPEKMNPLVYIALIFDTRYKLAGLKLSLYDLFGEVKFMLQV